MNTEEIERALRTTKDFDGVFSVDTLPDRPRLLVCNTDPSTKPGRHWICICVQQGSGEYFDSFGRRPSVQIERYLNRRCSSWTYNDRQLQSVISKFCGHYCIYYCVLRSRGLDMRKIVRSFTSDTALNDALVHRFACSGLY
jgi:hypothetical protein